MLTTRNSVPESSQVSELEILRKTLGERRGHQRGVGRKLKGQSSGRRSQPATADQPDLRETVVELQKQIQTLTQQMSRERREPMDVEMNDAAPTQPIRPQPSRSQMGFNPMGFQQPHQTPTSFQQLLQQPLLQQPLVPSPGMLSPEQFHSQMYQSYLQFVFQSPNNSQVLLNMMTQSPQTSHVSEPRMPQMSQMPQNVQMSTQGQQYQNTSQTMPTQPWEQTSQMMPTHLGQQTSQMMPTQQGQQTSQMMPTLHGQQTSHMMTSSQMPPYYPQMPDVPGSDVPRDASDEDDATTNFF
ncbi:uncharacterized protein LOC133030207 [Cannabis sativa]|uniref:uncharacterized protein LOC133030207 n=1 Tax=Cannabis sativa TaxID=3483 RepID=UPI0029C9E092|nr:uncharacterized protein LOC133030207 [Cannabis sativa]XP_060958596.1 uncharacterized protein LOC133030207 [Cannabis sativa]